jgi:methyl-accepting chemotaxis protein
MKNIKTGVKLGFGFLLVVVLLGGVAGYQILSMYEMKAMQDEGASRAADSIAVYRVQNELGNVYGVFADGMINRDLEETREGLSLLKEAAQRDIKLVHDLVDTEAERAKAKEFEEQYLLYIDGFENGILPILSKEESIEKRMGNSLDIMRIVRRVGEVYPVIADAVITRNLDETAAYWKTIRDVAAKDTTALAALSSSGQERALARDFGEEYEKYLTMFEEAMLPLLSREDVDWPAIHKVNRELKAVRDRVLGSLGKMSRSLEYETRYVIEDEAEIRRMDGEIDALRDKAGSNLEAIVKSLKEESEEADAAFDTTTDRTVSIAGVCIAVGILLSLIIAYLLTRSITKPLGRAAKFAKIVAQGDLSATLNVRQEDEVGVLADAMREMVDNLKNKIVEADRATEEAGEEAERAKVAMGEAEEAKKLAERAKSDGMNAAAEQLSEIVERVTSAAEELSAQVEQSSRGAETQRERAGETATAMEEMNATVLEVARNASSAAENATSAKEKAMSGSEIVGQVVKAIHKVQDQAQALKSNMGELGSQAEGIGQVLNVISDIADQTNLLALNAAIEAARAGDAGRGFAVVADEVRKLAEKTMSATNEVGTSIRAIQEGTRKNIENTDDAVHAVGESTELASKAGETLIEIVSLSETNADQVRSIATGAEEQSAASEEINRGAEEINRISSETSEAMNQSARAVSELAELSQELQRLIGEMRQA